MAAPKPKFMMLGKSKFVHVVYTKTYDLKHSECQQVRKFQVAGNVPKGNGLSPEAAAELEPCPHCEPGSLLKEMRRVNRKQESRQRTQDTLDKMRESRKVAKAKGRKSETGDKAPKSKPKQTMVSTGPKSLGDSRGKAEILRQFAEDHGWKAKLSDDKPNGIKLIAKRGPETITCWFSDGKYAIAPMGYIEVEGSDWQGKLRAAHACRRQMSNEGRDRPHPHPGAGRSAPRSPKEEPTPETESPEDAFKRVPFLLDDDDLAIIDAVKGKTIRWRNGVSGVVEEAQLPAEAEGKKRPKIAIVTHPKKNRRILQFFAVDGFDSKTGKEVFGPERSVALERVLRVIA